MRIQEIISYFEQRVPKSLKEDFDNVGLLIGNSDIKCTGVLITLDVTKNIIQEALVKKCNLIISHHPLIFKGLKSITPTDPIGKLSIQAIQNNIVIYAAHTNLDNAPFGVSHILAEKLGLKNMKPLHFHEKGLKKLVTFCPKEYEEKVRTALFDAGAGHIGNYDSCSYNSEGYGTFRALDNTNPFVGKEGELHSEPETKIEVIYEGYNEPSVVKALLNAHPYEEVAFDCYSLTNIGGKAGLGVVGELNNEISEGDFLQNTKRILGVPCLKHSKELKKMIKKVAICGGSGGSFIFDAISSKADAYITADLKYHDFQSCEDKLLLIDGGHYETERFAKELIHSLLSEKFSNFALLISEHNTNYTRYL